MTHSKPAIIGQGRWFYIEENGKKSIVFAYGGGGIGTHLLRYHVENDLFSRNIEEILLKVIAMGTNPNEWPLEDKNTFDLGE